MKKTGQDKEQKVVSLPSIHQRLASAAAQQGTPSNDRPPPDSSIENPSTPSTSSPLPEPQQDKRRQVHSTSALPSGPPNQKSNHCRHSSKGIIYRPFPPLAPPTKPLPPLPQQALAHASRKSTSGPPAATPFTVHRSVSERHAPLAARFPVFQHTRTRSVESGNKDSKKDSLSSSEWIDRVRSTRLKNTMDRQAEGSNLFVTEWLTVPEHPPKPDQQHSQPTKGTSSVPASISFPMPMSSKGHLSADTTSNSTRASTSGAAKNPMSPHQLKSADAAQEKTRPQNGSKSHAADSKFPPPPSRAQTRSANHLAKTATQRHHQLLHPGMHQQAGRLHDLEFRVSQLEHQNRILLAALFSAPRAKKLGNAKGTASRGAAAATESKLEPSPLFLPSKGSTDSSRNGETHDYTQDRRGSISSESIKELRYLTLDFNIDC